MYSSSESIGLLAVVTGVGGRTWAWVSETAAEAMILLLGPSSLLAEIIVASAALRFLVMGGIVATWRELGWNSAREEDERGMEEKRWRRRRGRYD